MLWRLVWRSIRERPAQAALVILAIAAGAAVATALLAAGFEISERIARQLRSFGANVVLVPRSEPLEITVGSLRYELARGNEYLNEADISRLRTIFWRHNIVALAPFLSRVVSVRNVPVLLVGTWFHHQVPAPGEQSVGAPGESAASEEGSTREAWKTGVSSLFSSWQVEGAWVKGGSDGALLGRALAARLGLKVGDRLRAVFRGRSEHFVVKGILRTGGLEEDQMFGDLAKVQNLFALADKVDKIKLSVLVTPDNSLAIRARKVGPKYLPHDQYERWSCTPYMDSVTSQIEKALPDAKAKVIRRVAETEGAVLGKFGLVFLLIGAVTVASTALAVATIAALAMFERLREIGIMKSVGAEPRQIALLFLLEMAITGLGGGAIGYLLGMQLARLIGAWVFATPITVGPALLPAVLIAGVGIAVLGAAIPLRTALRAQTVLVLKKE
jgi:putative ABC transport system permease protein